MRSVPVTICVAVSLAIASPPAGAQSSTNGHGASATTARAALAARVDSLAEAFIAEPQAPGVSISVVRAGRDTLVFKGYGKADVENDVPATPATVYRIGSITKQFTSAAVMRLVERGSVRLGDPIGKYLPELPEAWRPVMIRQLLNHTSGIPSYTDLGDAWAKRWGEHMSPDTLVALTAGKPMNFAPGTGWRYDNTGYVLLGMLLEKVTGQHYGAYLDSTIFRPLGLTSTRYCDRAPLVAHRSRGYQREGKTFTNAPYLDMSQPYAAGALCSTVGDLARWDWLLATGKVVSPASYAAMTLPQGIAKLDHYGFGLVRGAIGSHVMLTHGGGIHGFISSNAYFPSDSLSITVLANAAPSDPDGLLTNIARAIFGMPLVQPTRAADAIPLPDSIRTAVPGKYDLAIAGKKLLMTISTDSAGVVAQAAGQRGIPLFYIGDGAFGTRVDPGIRIRFAIENGRASRMSLEQGGVTGEGERIP